MKVVNFNNTGLSLIELLVALAISSILAIGVVQVYSSSKNSYYAQNDATSMQESGRFVYNQLINDLRRAGYYGYNDGLENISGTQALVPNLNQCPSTDQWALMLDRHITGLNDNATGYNCIGNYLQGDIIALRYVEGRETTVFNNTEYYLRSSFKSARVFKGAQEAANLINDGTPVSTGRLKAFAYYIGTDVNRNCRFPDNTNAANPIPIPIPILYRESLAIDGTPQRQEIAKGIEDIQFKYGVDTTGNRSVNQYFDADVIEASATFNWSDVVSVRFWILARSECPSAKLVSQARTYDLGGVSEVSFTDRFKRRVFTSTVALRN